MNKSKKKGTRAETAVVKALVAAGLDAKRVALSGNKDNGDVLLDLDGIDFTIEVKSGKMTANPSRSQVIDWAEQATIESKNAGTHGGLLIVVRYNRKLSDADVWRQADDDPNLLLHMYFDDWVESMT